MVLKHNGNDNNGNNNNGNNNKNKLRTSPE